MIRKNTFWNRKSPNDREVKGLMRIIEVSADEITAVFPNQLGSEVKTLPKNYMPRKHYPRLGPQELFEVTGNLRTKYGEDLKFARVEYLPEGAAVTDSRAP